MNAINKFSPANLLLSALPQKKSEHFIAGCEKVNLTLGEVLCEAGDNIKYVYFPTESFISLIVPLDNRARLEVAVIGNEGMHGISLLLGVNISPQQALVQGAGAAWRMKTKTFLLELKQNAALEQILKRYLYVMMSQISQMSACVRFHVLESRLARWLLMTQDRAHSDIFYVTHLFLACMLGVRRAGVTKAASLLQKQKLISYSRGNLTILDRSGLKQMACACYQTDKKIYASIMVENSGS